MNKIILVALVAFTLFSCSNEAEMTPEVETGNASLYLSISMTKTRAMTDPVEKLPMAITKLIVQAYDDYDNKVGDTLSISGERLTKLMAANTADPGSSANQIVLEALSSNAAYIRVWGYHDTLQIATPIYTGREDINNLQALGFNGVPYEAGKIKIFKSPDLGTGAYANHRIWRATANIKPYLAHFEITGTPKLKSNGDLKGASLVVSGIYMNNIKLDAQKTTLPTLKAGNGGYWDFSNNNGNQVDKKNTGGNWESSYYTAYKSMFDGLPKAATNFPDSALTIKDTLNDNSLWTITSKTAASYNLYPQNVTPHLVLCVVVDSDGKDQTTNDRFYGFVTLSKFRKGAGADAGVPTDASGLLSGIISGNLYQINLSDLELTAKDITPAPESKDQDLYLKLTVTPWNQVKLKPEL